MLKIHLLNEQSQNLCRSANQQSLKLSKTGFVLRKKRKVQKLSSANIEKRLQRVRGFYLQLANGRYRNFIITCFYLDCAGGKRKVCYIKKPNSDYDRMIIQQDSSQAKGLMVWHGN